MLEHAEPERRLLAVKGIRNTHARWQEILAVLVRMVDDPDARVRLQSLEYLALWQSKRIANVAVPKLMERLNDSDALCRVAAARAIWNISRQAKDIVPVCRKEMHNKDSKVRTQAISSLRAMSKDCLPAWEELVYCA